MRAYIIFLFAITISVVSFSCKTTKTTGDSPKKKEITQKSGDLDPLTQQRVKRTFVDACTQMMRGDNASAIELFEEVLSADPANHAAMFNISKILITQRQFDEAIRYGKAALEKEKNNFWYYESLQKAYENNGDYPNAIKTQEEIVSHFPKKLDQKLKLSELYLRNNQPEKALSQLNQIEQDKGPSEEIYFKKFQIYNQQKQFEKGLDAANQLIGLNPQETRYYQFKIDMLKRLSREAEAIAIFQEILDRDPENGYALLSLADYYKSINQIEKSDEYLFKAFSNPGISPDGKIIIIEGLMNYLSNEPQIMPRIKKLTSIFNETHPGSAKAYAIQGKMLFLEGQIDSARVYYRKALEIEPANTTTWLDLLETSLDTKYFDRLYKDAGDALEYYPNQERFLFFYGISGSFLEKYGPAIHALEKVKKIGPEDKELLAQACAELGKIYHRQENYEESDKNYLQAMSLTPDDPFLLNNYAYYLSVRNDKLAKAQEYIEKALKILPEQISFQDTYGWILYQQGKFAEAEKWLAKAAKNSSSSVILEHYGDVLNKQGKKEEAIVQWKKAIENGATDLEIEEKLGGQ
ncbi:MAG: tetratricopeptide repeat protein [Bacteroidetes bacterium]|nr:tetratricopeptide repeat protein [Bacteroidota bacterium]